MPKVQAVNSVQHARYSWTAYSHYKFAADDAYAPLVVNEFNKASVMAPIAFSRVEGAYSPVLLMGLQPGVNLFVSVQGKWLGSYVPAFYRSHPFCMAKNQKGEALLSVHCDSEFLLDRIVPGGPGKLLFMGGEMTEDLREILTFLQRVESNRQATVEFCSRCDDLGLFIPWEVSVTSENKKLPINGLHRIDEDRLRSITPGDAKDLLESGAMAAIYSHLGSLQLISQLVYLKQRKIEEESLAETGQDLSDFMPIVDEEQPLNLDW